VVALLDRTGCGGSDGSFCRFGHGAEYRGPGGDFTPSGTLSTPV
jgi:hypothetical protein